MKSLLLLFTCTIFLHASKITLNEILQKVEDEHPMSKSIEAYQHAYASQNKALLSNEAPVLSIESVYAQPDTDTSKYEYAIGIEQNILSPGVKRGIARSASYMNDALLLEQKENFLILKNSISFLYHVNCLDIEDEEQYKRSLVAFEELYEKKAKAYKYAEISKKELLQLQIELKRQKNEYKRYLNRVKTSRQNLESKTILPFLKERILSCKDIKPIAEEFSFADMQDSLYEEALDKKIQSVKSDFERYDSPFDSFTISASYQNEIDTDRFTFGLSIPLNFISSYNEQSQAASLYKKSALEYEKEEFSLKKASDIKLLRQELARTFEDIELSLSMLVQYEDELLPLVEKAYRSGEDSAIEYLLTRREMLNLNKELTAQRKEYYKTLFELYRVTQIKD